MNGDEVEIGMVVRPLLRQLGQVEVAQLFDTPVEMNFALQAALEGVLDHALDRGEARGASDEDDRPLRFAQ